MIKPLSLLMPRRARPSTSGAVPAFGGHRSERGQFLVIVAVGMVVIVALVGLVIDGGFAWGQQRKTQNGADSIALAGATVLAQTLKGVSKTDGDVGCAVASAASSNGITNPVAYYSKIRQDNTVTTDLDDNPATPPIQVGPCAAGGGSAVPAGAQGVKATGNRQFPTFLARVIGIDQFTSTATATAIAGVVNNICAASAGCAVLPVTFPLTAVTCDGQNRQLQLGVDWPIVQTVSPSLPNYATTANEAIIPLCSVGAGAVGWLDLGPNCGNLSQTITTPCNVSIPIPTWIQTKAGNTNALDSDLNTFAGPQLGVPDDSTVLIPINNNTCNNNPNSDGLPGDPTADDPNCPGNGDNSADGSGNGNNFYYHIPKFTTFMIDRAYTSGNNPPECNSTPGFPLSGGNGATGCLKGWFIDYVYHGPVGPGATGPQDVGLIGVQLVN
jgi:Flp pilus assembly protein TadG